MFFTGWTPCVHTENTSIFLNQLVDSFVAKLLLISSHQAALWWFLVWSFFTIGIWTSVVISPHKPIDHRSSAQSLYSITTPVPSKLSLTCVKNRHETLELSNLGTLTVLWLQDYLNPLFEFQSNFNLQIEFCREMLQQNRRFQHLFGQPWCIFFWIWYGQSVGGQGLTRHIPKWYGCFWKWGTSNYLEWFTFNL